MQCHECGRDVRAGDRFCTGCGISLAGVTEPTAAVPVVTAEPGGDDADDPTAAVATSELAATEPLAQVPADAAHDDPDDDAEWDAAHDDPDDDPEWDDPVWAVTGAIPETADLPATEPITEVWTDQIGDDAGATTEVPVASETATSATVTAEVPATAAMPLTASPLPAGTLPADHRFRFTITTLIGIVGGLLVLVTMFATVVEVRASTRLRITDEAPVAFRTGTWIADELGSNLSIAGLLAALAMVLGGVAAAFGWRWGSGLVGGGGLAAAGLAAILIGLAQYPIDAAHEFARIPSEQQFTLTITRALGYWLAVVAGAVGVVAFFASSNDAFGDRRNGLNPWIAALGALAVVVATAGPLIPDGTAVFSDNWYVIERPGEAPAMLVAMRLVQLGLFAVGGVIGFLSVRRWGLGVAAGATFPLVWLGVSTLFEIGEQPIGPAFRNPGATTTDLHGVTIIGLSATLAMLVLGAVAAYDQSVRER